MIDIEFKNELNEEIYKYIDNEFNKYALKNEVVCNFMPFSFIAKKNGKMIGVITGHSYYEEAYIENLIVLDEYRHKHIGSSLIKMAEEYLKEKNAKHINLTTYRFQAPEFYKKCGYTVEFLRENKENPKLDKFFLIKYL